MPVSRSSTLRLDGRAVARFQNRDTAGAIEAELGVYSLMPAAAAGRDLATVRSDISGNLRRLVPRPPPRVY